MRLWRPLLVVLLLAAAALAPIRSYDSFWHLASGRWILDHRALPLTDPFAIASDRVPWINGEWLFQVAARCIELLGGLTAVWIARALLVGAIFVIGWRTSNAPLLASLAFLGGHQQLDARPSAAAALLLVLAIATVRKPILFVLVTIVWINVHPSALLAPLVALLLTREPRTMAASAVALLVNPFGWRGIAAPLALTSYVGSGELVNAEWLPSPPLVFPMLYITVVIAAVLFALSKDKRSDLWRTLLLAVFAALAIRHVRNQGLWFAAFPMLAVGGGGLKPVLRWLAPVPILYVLITTPHTKVMAPGRFPVRAVPLLGQLRGNIYNPDQFGGYLIHAVYPERRVLTDGRNELYHRFNQEYAVAREDGRAWNALLRKYRIDLAVDEYRPPLDVINGVTGAHQSMPASLAYWPRAKWALIGYDDAAMVFARRAAYPREVLEKLEVRGVVPDAAR
ncbi:MAG TPA: hypothetical protein VGR02_03420 [Thermoanaerobaculia bacterium]|jgi:hypothetical protein|nr:hypothetical protein [Thermoanaerobaculia bacterium]